MAKWAPSLWSPAQRGPERALLSWSFLFCPGWQKHEVQRNCCLTSLHTHTLKCHGCFHLGGTFFCMFLAAAVEELSLHAVPPEDPLVSCRCCKGGQLCSRSSQSLSLPVTTGLPPHRAECSQSQHSGLTATGRFRRRVWEWKKSNSKKHKLWCSLAVLLCWDTFALHL